MSSGPIGSWEIDGETVSDFSFWGSKITADGDCSHEIKRRLLLGRKVMTNLDQIRSVAQSCPTLCDPMNCSTPGLPVHHQLLELAQTHIHRVADEIQLSKGLSRVFSNTTVQNHQFFGAQLSLWSNSHTCM